MGMMMQIANYLEVEYLPVVTPTPEEAKDGILFAQRVQQIIAKALGVPATKHAGEDLVLATAAATAGLPFEAGLVQWQRLTEDLAGMRVKGALNILKQFKALDPNARGEVDFQGFAQVMRKLAQEPVTLPDGQSHVPSPPSDAELKRIFAILDRRDRGTINFEDYLASAAVINGLEKDDRTAGWDLAFELYGQGAKEFSKEQVQEFTARVLPHISMKFEELFAKVDLDNNGHMSKDEFIAFIEKHQKELNLRPTMVMHNLPMRMSTATIAFPGP